MRLIVNALLCCSLWLPKLFIGAMLVGAGQDVVRALELSIKQERLIWGEPTDRPAVAVEDVINREYDRLSVTAGYSDLDDDDAEDAEAE